MQSKSKRGIVCDCCGLLYEDNFTYFSFDFHYIDFVNRLTISEKLASPVKDSIDCCFSCFDSFRNLIIINYVPPVLGVIKCDLTGEMIDSGYYYCVISKVIVVIKGENSPAKVDVDKRFIELNVSSKHFESIVNKRNNLRNNASAWDTKV